MYGSLFEDLKYTWSPFVNNQTSTQHGAVLVLEIGTCT